MGALVKRQATHRRRATDHASAFIGPGFVKAVQKYEGSCFLRSHHFCIVAPAQPIAGRVDVCGRTCVDRMLLPETTVGADRGFAFHVSGVNRRMLRRIRVQYANWTRLLFAFSKTDQHRG